MYCAVKSAPRAPSRTPSVRRKRSRRRRSPAKGIFRSRTVLQRNPSLRSLRTVSAGPEFESPAVYQNFSKNFGRDGSDFATTLPEIFVAMSPNRKVERARHDEGL